jgi:uncharacterized RmlC-like cupin family protein
MAEHSHPPIPPAPEDGWKNQGVRVIPADSLDHNTAQTPGMDRAAAINFARVGAQKLWAGTVHIHANAKTGAHHHGHLEVSCPLTCSCINCSHISRALYMFSKAKLG